MWKEYFTELKEIKPDALIISDPVSLRLPERILPEMEIHISTQANNTNYRTFLFWYKQGAKRVVTRELSLKEIREIREHIPEDMEIESFIHGAMCISYSGRCLQQFSDGARREPGRLYSSVPLEICGGGGDKTGRVDAGL